TGGSDFHGSLKPEIQMGVGSGTLAVPYTLYEALAAALAARRGHVAAGARE
ncbi:MAG: hypothetical protein JRF23_03230, partial [Deltaproteobacteria bacterium]|nr:hypothetical protein [Deltaproteobacteria bacterium]